MDFGVFVEVMPGQEGLIHISEFPKTFALRLRNMIKVGDILPVKVKEIDAQGRINLKLLK